MEVCSYKSILTVCTSEHMHIKIVFYTVNNFYNVCRHSEIYMSPCRTPYSCSTRAASAMDGKEEVTSVDNIRAP